MSDTTTAQAGTGNDTATAAAPATDERRNETIAGGGAPDTPAPAPDAKSPAAAPAGGWPDDWRDRLASGDDAFRKRLDRFASPNDFTKSFRELEKKFSSGQRDKLPDNATPEQVAQWRKDNGIPDNKDAYIANLALPDGVVLGEADKPIASAFAEFAHGKNWDNQRFNEAMEWYYDFQGRQVAAQEDADAAFKQESVAALQGDWQGADYRRNVTAVKNMMASWPAEVRDGVLAARTPEGRKLGDMPGFIKQLASVALDLNPAATLVPAGQGNPTKGVEERIKELETWMAAPQGSADWAKYHKDEAVRKEYRDLIDVRDKLKARAA